MLLHPRQGVEQLGVEGPERVTEAVIGRRDDPEALGFLRAGKQGLRLRHGQEFVMRGVNVSERYRGDAVHESRRAECRFVRDAMREVDHRVAPAPAEFGDIRHADTDDAADVGVCLRVGRGEHREPRAFRHADENRFGDRAATGPVRQPRVVLRFVGRRQRRAARRETLEIGA